MPTGDPYPVVCVTLMIMSLFFGIIGLTLVYLVDQVQAIRERLENESPDGE